MTRTDPDLKVRMEEAAAWWARFQECEPAADDMAAWLAWMDQEPENAAAFESLNELALRIRQTRTEAPAVLQPLVEQRPSRGWLRNCVAFLSSMSFSNAASLPTRYVLVTCLVAAAGVALLFAGVPRLRLHYASDRPASGQYITPTAGQREVLLEDGSRLVLGGASAIATEFSAKRRMVRLLCGEAYFEVKHEVSGRPFEVDAGFATVRAIGTAFDVRKDDRHVAVTVTEGRVKIERKDGFLSGLAAAAGIARPQIAEAGRAQQVVIEPDATRLAVTTTDPVRVTSWRRGHLEFIDEPLDEVIRSVSRYSVKPLKGDDPALRSITYTGSFVPEHLDGWLEALQNVFPVEVRRTDGVTVIQARAPSTR